MTTHDEYRLQLGAYITRSLDPIEQAELEDHLTHCKNCRDEVATLSPITNVLLRIPTSGRTIPEHRLGADQAEKLTRAASSAVRRRARRAKLLTGSAVVFAAAAAVVATVVVDRSGTPVPSRVLTLHAISGTSGNSSALATAALDNRPWGTQIVLTVSHLSTGSEFVATVWGTTGKQNVGMWRSTPNGHMVVQLATALSPDAIKGLMVRTTTGVMVLQS